MVPTADRSSADGATSPGSGRPPGTPPGAPAAAGGGVPPLKIIPTASPAAISNFRAAVRRASWSGPRTSQPGSAPGGSSRSMSSGDARRRTSGLARGAMSRAS